MALTKVTGQVIKNTTDVTVGVLTVTNTLAVGGTVSIGGTLTYEDVTNVDAVGLVTARNGIVVGSGITLSKDGDVFFTGIATGNGSGLTNLPAANLTGTLPAISGANLTNLDASDLASGTVPTARLGSGTASSSTFLRGDSTFQTVNTDLVSDTSPQLGGNLDVNTKNITFGDSGGASDDRLTFGAGTDLSIYHDGTNTTFDNNTGQFNLDGASGSAIRFLNNGTYQCQVGSAGLDLPDTKKIRLGDSEDLELQHDGTNNVIKTTTSAEIQFMFGSEYMARFLPNGSSILYDDNVRALQTDGNGIGVYGPEGGSAQILLYSDEGDDNADKWRILNNNSDFLKIQTYKSGSWQDTISAQAENQVRLFYNGSEKLNTTNIGVSLTGQLYFNNGNVKFGASGNGIDFSSSQTPSSKTGATTNSEVFDHYEEGTFTPTYDGTWTNISNSNVRHSRYTRVGDVCHVWMEYFMTSNNGAYEDNSNLRGFPFTGRSSLYVPVTLTIMYGPSNYSTDANAAGRAYFDSYDDRLYFKMGNYDGIRHIWVQFSYLVG